jgi:hypothetical protein
LISFSRELLSTNERPQERADGLREASSGGRERVGVRQTGGGGRGGVRQGGGGAGVKDFMITKHHNGSTTLLVLLVAALSRLPSGLDLPAALRPPGLVVVLLWSAHAEHRSASAHPTEAPSSETGREARWLLPKRLSGTSKGAEGRWCRSEAPGGPEGGGGGGTGAEHAEGRGGRGRTRGEPSKGICWL